MRQVNDARDETLEGIPPSTVLRVLVNAQRGQRQAGRSTEDGTRGEGTRGAAPTCSAVTR
jgi:hypothetical protein